MDEGEEAFDEEEVPEEVETMLPPEPTATPMPTAIPEPTAKPEPDMIPDPDPVYGYSRRSNDGNQYWLVNTVDGTVEYYSEVDKTYWIGDYSGSLMSGMNVMLRGQNKIINIALKFQQTYKFALMNGDGVELLMEQEDISKVEAAITPHRK